MRTSPTSTHPPLLATSILEDLALPQALLELLADEGEMPQELRTLVPAAQAAINRIARYASALDLPRPAIA
jgi:hypothetical protein